MYDTGELDRYSRKLYKHFGVDNPFSNQQAFSYLWPDEDYWNVPVREKLWVFGLRTHMRRPGGARLTEGHYLVNDSQRRGDLCFTRDLVLLARQLVRADARPNSTTAIEVLRVIREVADDELEARGAQ